jgi:hypothetical protein
MAVPHTLGLFFKHPEMFIQRMNFDTVGAFIQGFDSACNGGVLVGFREWLIVKLEHGNNLVWPELFLRFAFPESDAPSTEELPKADQKHLIGLLFETIEAFCDERDMIGGLQQIYLRYHTWLQTQNWYREVKTV